MRAEHELLLCVARKSLDEDVVRRLRSLAQEDIDWGYLSASSSKHGLLPLLYTHLNNHARELVPASTLEQLRTEFLDNSRGNLYLLRELLRVLTVFEANGIRALAFKGPLLAEMLYGDAGLRRTGDLDLLISKDDFSKVRDILHSSEYLMEPQLTSSQQAAHLHYHCEIQFKHQDEFSVVDLHWGLTPKSFPFALGFEELLNRSQSVSVGGRAVRTFGDEDLLLYLCVHGAKHYWSRLEWVASVAELVRSTSFDWPIIVERARQSKTERILLLGLHIAGELFAFELPREISALVDERDPIWKCAAEMRQRLFADMAEPTQLEMFRFNSQFMDRKWDALTGLVRSAMVPTISDWETVTLPRALYPLYYGVRSIRLLGKYGRGSKTESSK